MWATWTDDALNGEVGENRDDARTNAFTVGVHHGRMLAVLDYGNLTDKGGRGGPPARVDEATATLGAQWQPLEGRRSATLASGAGARWSGDLGGARIQNGWHRALGLAQVQLPYEASACDPLGYVRGSWQEGLHASSVAHLAADLSVEALATAGGEWQGEAALRALAMGTDAEAWFGLVRVMRGGTPASRTARVVAAHERGWWLVAGYSVGPYSLSGAVSPRTRAAYGQVSVLLGRPALHRDAPSSTITGAIGPTAFAAGLVDSVRWRPPWPEAMAGLGQRLSVVVDHRFGRVPGWTGTDTSLRFRQVSVGLDLAAVPGPDRPLPVPFVQVMSGWRLERIQHEGPSPGYSEQRTASGVTHVSAGVRFGLAEDSPYGISCAGDVWIPWRHAEAEGGAAYLRPGAGAHLSWMVRAPW